MAARKQAAVHKTAGTGSGRTNGKPAARSAKSAATAAGRAKPASGTARKPAATATAKRPSRGASAAAEREAVIAALRAILVPYGRKMRVTLDGPKGLSVDAGYSAEYKRDIFFGAVQAGKSYVSFHLMPVYVFPELLKGMSTGLRRRMQGKSCFNFETVDRELFAELKQLTAAGYDIFKKAGLA